MLKEKDNSTEVKTTSNAAAKGAKAGKGPKAPKAQKRPKTAASSKNTRSQTLSKPLSQAQPTTSTPANTASTEIAASIQVDGKRAARSDNQIDGKLSAMQALFVDEYIIDFNGTAAAERAGGSPKSAHSTASKWVRMPKIVEAIRLRMMDRVKRTECTQDSVIQTLIEIADRCMQRRPVVSWQVVDGHRQLEQTTDPETGEGIWSFNATGALRAVELLGKHMAMFTDRSEIVNTDLGSELDKAINRGDNVVDLPQTG